MNNCALATQVTTSINLVFRAGNQTISFDARSINQSSVSALVNGNPYTLSPNASAYINNTNAYIQLISISGHNPPRIAIQVCSLNGSVTTQLFRPTSLPSYTSAASGQSVTTYLDLQNTGAYPEYLTLSLPAVSAVSVQSSASSVYLESGASIGIPLTLSSINGTVSGLYVIPVNVSAVSSIGLREATTEYLMLDLKPVSSSLPSTSSQIQVVTNNNQTTVTGTIRIRSAIDSSIDNLTLHISFPPSLTAASNLTAYGLPNNITIVNGTYAINWFIRFVPANSSTYAYYYYTLNKSAGTSNIQYIHNAFSLTARDPRQP